MPLASLSIIRYKKRFIPFALLAMAVHHIPLWFNKNISFYKLMGTGRNGTFDKVPDWQQWAVLIVSEDEKERPLLPEFLNGWYNFFGCETFSILLEPIEGHGFWDGKKPFGILERKTDYEGRMAVLTRATIRLRKLRFFWNHVAPVSNRMRQAAGFEFSAGIGELPWIKQATFSVWSSKEAMKAFAYGTSEHAEVIQKTRQQDWYSQEMFVRFKIIETKGTVLGKNP